MEDTTQKILSKKERRRILRQERTASAPQNFDIKNVSPMTFNQKNAFEAWDKGKNLLLHGLAGTGKSFISLYLALKTVLYGQSHFKKIVIVRSVVPTRDMGFLPGSPAEKAKMYELPYYAIFTELFGRGDAYEYFKKKGLVEFISTSFIRGITINDSIVVVDEIANLTLHELDSVITRVGKNCRIVFSGDFRQSDFVKEQDKNGIMDFMRILERIKSFEFIDFQENDIVRSGLVKEYIIQKNRLGIVA